jgi:cysteine desulfurase
MKTTYLDHAAGTPLRLEVLNAMLPFLSDTYGNPSSIHHVGRRAHDVLTHARAGIARTLGVAEREIIFTSGGTEANNLALTGVMRKSEKKHFLVSHIEHPSVIESAECLRKEGCDVEYIPVQPDGRVSPDEVMSRVRTDTALISIMYANNEIGTIEPIQEIATSIRKTLPNNTRPLFHTDACQAAGRLPLSPLMLGVDLMTVSASKIGGPRGIGLLFVQDGTQLTPTMVGGHQESSQRAGTESAALAVGFEKALALATHEREETNERLTVYRDMFIQNTRERIPDAILNGHETDRLANNIHFTFPGIEGESLVLLLDTHGVCVSTGSACNAEDLRPSHVLRAIGQSPELIHGSLRLTLGRTTTETELNHALTVLTASVARLRTFSPITHPV